MKKIHLSFVLVIIMIISSCPSENFEGISISSIPRNYNEASIIKVTHNTENTEFSTVHDNKYMTLTIKPSLKKIFNKIHPNYIKINRIFNSEGVTTYLSLYENEKFCLVIADNDPMLTKPFDKLTLLPGDVYKTHNNDKTSKRTMISIIVSNENTTNLNPGEGFEFQINSNFWMFYYLAASIPNSEFRERSSHKSIPMEESAFLVDWIAVLQKDLK